MFGCFVARASRAEAVLTSFVLSILNHDFLFWVVKMLNPISNTMGYSFTAILLDLKSVLVLVLHFTSTSFLAKNSAESAESCGIEAM